MKTKKAGRVNMEPEMRISMCAPIILHTTGEPHPQNSHSSREKHCSGD